MKLRRTGKRVIIRGREYVVALDQNSAGWLCIKNKEEMLLPLFGPVSKNYKPSAFDAGRNTTNDPYIAALRKALQGIG